MAIRCFLLLCIVIIAQAAYIKNDTEVVTTCETCVENGTFGFYKEVFVSWSGPQYFCRDTPLDPEFGMIVDFACNKSKSPILGMKIVKSNSCNWFRHVRTNCLASVKTH